MQGIKSYTHEEREKVIQSLIPIIKEKLGDNFLALAAGGSYARHEDKAYSDIELVAFVKQPLEKDWEIRKIVDGLYIVVIVDTKESYIKKYLEVSDIWYASAADKLLPIINENLVNEINNFQPADIETKSLTQIEKRWHMFQEITAKTLNAINDNNKENFPIIIHQMLKELLVILSFLNMTPYVTLGKYVTQVKQFSIKPERFDDLVTISINGEYQDLSKLSRLIEDMFSDLEMMLKNKGLQLYSDSL